jgi:hypothetical protein
MLGLVHAEQSATGKVDLRERPPALLLNGRTGDPLLREGRDLLANVIRQNVELMAFWLSRMHCDLTWRQGEDQPAVAGVDVTEAERVAQESAILHGIVAVDQEMRADDHGVLPPRDQ